MQNRGSNMNLEKIQSKDQRPLISCFVIIVSHSRPSRHTLPRGTVRRCFSIGRKPLPRTTRLYGCTGLLHCYTLPKRPRCTVASFMLPKRDASSSPKRPAGERKKRRRRSRRKTAFVPPTGTPVHLNRPACAEIEMVPLRDQEAMPKLKKKARGKKSYVKPSVTPEVVDNIDVKCNAIRCKLACCTYLLLEVNAAEMCEIILNTRRSYARHHHNKMGKAYLSMEINMLHLETKHPFRKLKLDPYFWRHRGKHRGCAWCNKVTDSSCEWWGQVSIKSASAETVTTLPQR